MPTFHSGHEGGAWDEIILHATPSSGLKNKVAVHCNSETFRFFSMTVQLNIKLITPDNKV